MQIDASKQIGFIQVTGQVTGMDLFQANEQLYSHPQWQAGFNEYWDCSGITSLIIDPDQVRQIVQQELDQVDRLGEGRVAIVATRYSVEMIGRLYKMMLEHAPAGREVQLFQAHSSAQDWLGLQGLPPWLQEGAEAAAPVVPRAA